MSCRRLRRAALVLALALPSSVLGACGQDSPVHPPKLEAPEPATRPAAGAEAGVVRTEPTPAQVAPPTGDREPNDDWRHAIKLQAGEPAVGRVDTPDDPAVGDEDWYVLEVPGEDPALVSAELAGADDIDIVLEWMNTGDKPRALVQADVQEKQPGPERLGALRAGPGPVYFRVRGAWYRGKDRVGSERPYSLLVTVAPLGEGVEAEPNDTPAQAVALALDTVGRGLLGHLGDRDVWRIALPDSALGERLRVQTTGVIGVIQEVSLALEGDPGALTRGRGETDEGVTFRNVGIPRAGAPALFVTVRAKEGAAPSTPYELRVVLEEASTELVEREPNDGPASATTVGEPGPVTGHIDRAGDSDHIALVVRERATLSVTLEPPLDTNLALSLLGPDGEGRARIDEAGPGEAELMRGYGVGPGTWTLVVEGHSRADRDPVRPYRLDLRLTEGGSDEQEPNDERDMPGRGALEAGTTRKGWIHPRGDVDWWRLDLSAATEGQIVTLRVEPPAGVPLNVAIHGADGVKLTGRDGLRAGEQATFTHFLAPGAYDVKVSSPNGEAANAQNSYALTLVE